MDGLDFFRKLGAGAKFNLKRFRKDAEILEIVKRKQTASAPCITEQTEPPRPGKRHLNDDNNTSTANKRLKEDEDEENSGVQLLGNRESKITVAEKKPKKVHTKASLAQIKQEKLNHFRNQHQIHVHGTDVPDPAATFQEIKEGYNVGKRLLTNLAKMNLNTPTPIQMQAIPAMMERREILGCAPTGSGKTLAFLLPVLHHLKGPQRKGFRALILAPTRELARQIHRECVCLADGIGIKVVFLEKQSTAAAKYGPKSSHKFDILVTTPNRLIYLINQDPPIIDLSNVEWLVVDESDKLFEDGDNGFRQQLATIYQACTSPALCRALFSATFAYEVEQWCRLNLNNLIQVYIGARNSATDTIDQRVEYVGNESGKLIAIRELIRKGVQPPVLVFVQSKERAKELFHELIYDRINVDVIHSDRTLYQRDRVVEMFREGRVWFLLCTEMMGRGIDFKGVNLVINYDFPTSAVSYIHRIGRTGRAGRRGEAITYFTDQDLTLMRSIVNVMRGAGCPVPDYMLTIKPPNKNDKKRLLLHAPKRKTIRTMPKEKRKKKKTKSKTEKNGTEGSDSKHKRPLQKKDLPTKQPQKQHKLKTGKMKKVVKVGNSQKSVKV